jgi:ribosomal-protein-alanine N-acetyltransferase
MSDRAKKLNPRDGHESQIANRKCFVADIRLRDIRPEDLEALFRLDQLCFEPGIAYSREELLRFLELPTAQGMLAVVKSEGEGRLAGFVLGGRADRKTGHVITLDVAPQFRRRGVGRALLAELLSRLTRAGAHRAILEVDVGNAAAIAFYRRFGFCSRRRLPDYYAPGRAALEMESFLEPPPALTGLSSGNDT